MNHEGYDQQFAAVISARAMNPEMPAPDWLTPAEWDEVAQLAALERELRQGISATPPLDRDPVAAMLGLIRDPHIPLSPRALKQVRQRAKLSVGDLAARLAARGWEVTLQDVFRWENQSAHDVSPALIDAIAVELGTAAQQLTANHQATGTLVEAARSLRFHALATRLATALGTTSDLADSQLRGAAFATVHRGDQPDQQQWLDTLEAYVSAMEARHERG